MQTFNRLFSLATKTWFVAAYILLIALVFLYIDLPLAEYLHNLNLRANLPFLNFFTKLGSSTVYLILFPIAALFFRYLYKRPIQEARFWFLWIYLIFADLICVLIKVTLGRARPSLWFESKLFGFYGFHTKAEFWSFPSGHTTTIMAVAIGLCFLFPRYWLIPAIIGFLVAISRVLLTHHYLSDIMAATYLTFIELGLLLWLFKKFKPKHEFPFFPKHQSKHVS